MVRKSPYGVLRNSDFSVPSYEQGLDLGCQITAPFSSFFSIGLDDKSALPKVLCFQGVIGDSIAPNVSAVSNVSGVFRCLATISGQKGSCTKTQLMHKMFLNFWVVSWLPRPHGKEWIRRQILFRRSHPSLQRGAVLDRRSKGRDPLTDEGGTKLSFK